MLAIGKGRVNVKVGKYLFARQCELFKYFLKSIGIFSSLFSSFLIAIKDISYSIQHGSSWVIYGWSIARLSTEPKNERNMQSVVETSLNALPESYKCNGLVLNPTKSEFIVFGHRSTPTWQAPKIRMSREGDHIHCGYLPMTRNNSCEYLGLIVDRKLSWKEHIGRVAAKIRWAIALPASIRDTALLK